jgi:hypothetical protein
MKSTIYRYPGLRAFSRDESHIFFARSEEIRTLYNLIKARNLSVLFAKSGTGKSSLLNAGVLPSLESEEYRTFSIRFQEITNDKSKDNISPKDRLAERFATYAKTVGLAEQAELKLQEFEELFKQKAGLWAKLRAYDFEGNHGVIPVIVLDQFEEFFDRSSKEQEEFIEVLADLAHQRIPKDVQQAFNKTLEQQIPSSDSLLGLPIAGTEVNTDLVEKLNWWKRPLNYKVVISIRSDRLHLMDDLSAAIPAILDNRYQLHPLNKQNAREAIVGPAQLKDEKFSAPAFKFSTSALDSILKHLSNEEGEIESFQLQIICSSLEEKVIEEGLSQVDIKDVGDRKGIHNILNNYYENKIQRIGSEEEERKVRNLIETGLIIEGSRVSIAEAMILSYYNISADLLERIVETRLIKPEKTKLGNTYELAHDTLIAPILTSYDKRKALEEKAAELERIKALEAKAAEEHRLLTMERKRYRRVLYLMAAVGAFAIIAVISTVFALFAWNDKKDLLNQHFERSYQKGLALLHIKNEYEEAEVAFGDALSAARGLKKDTAIIRKKIDYCEEKLSKKTEFRKLISRLERLAEQHVRRRSDSIPALTGCINELAKLDFNHYRLLEKLIEIDPYISQYQKSQLKELGDENPIPILLDSYQHIYDYYSRQDEYFPYVSTIQIGKIKNKETIFEELNTKIEQYKE